MDKIWLKIPLDWYKEYDGGWTLRDYWGNILAKVYYKASHQTYKWELYKESGTEDSGWCGCDSLCGRRQVESKLEEKGILLDKPLRMWYNIV